jgi:hypothetical protein
MVVITQKLDYNTTFNFNLFMKKGTSMAELPEKSPANESELKKQMEQFQAAQQAYLEQAFRWLLEYIASYFPTDQVALEDLVTDVQFHHLVRENNVTMGVLVYRFRKILDKANYFAEISKEYEKELKVPIVFFIDTQTSQFEIQGETHQEGKFFLEIPPDKLTGKIRELRDELVQRSKLKSLRASL